MQWSLQNSFSGLSLVRPVNTQLQWDLQTGSWICFWQQPNGWIRDRKYAKFGVFYAKIVQMTPLRLRRESLWLRKFCGNKQGATSTPEIFSNKHSFVLTFFATNTIYVNYNRCKSSKLKNYTARQNRKRVNYDQSLLNDRHHGFELSRSADRHSYFVYP